MNIKELSYSDNPSMGTVKHVTQLHLKLLTDEFDDEDMDKFVDAEESEGELMQLVLTEKGIEGLQSIMWSQSMLEPLQTICLATDKKFEMDDLNDMGAKDFNKILNHSEDALGGDAQDFLKELGVDTSLMQRLNEQVENQSSNKSGKQMQPSG